jgi:hypothetical protein
MLTGDAFIQEVLVGHQGTCYELFRMQRDTFLSLTNTLRASYLEDTQHVRVEEALAIFCLIVGHRQGQRVAADRFQHSTETICRHVKRVMRALCNLGKSLIRPTHQVVCIRTFTIIQSTSLGLRYAITAHCIFL